VESVVFPLTAASVAVGLGRYSYYVSADDIVRIRMYTFYLGQLGVWASSLARVSIACMLLQFEISTIWKRVLRLGIGIMFAIAVFQDIGGFGQCQPITANSDTTPIASCWSMELQKVWLYTVVRKYA
jgi:hypothetical protein